MSTTLSNGQITQDPRLDRAYQLDWRSLDYAIGNQLAAFPIYKPRSYTWAVDEWLDQGPDGACVGFAFAHDLVARPVTVLGVTEDYARELYYSAQKQDPWTGGAYPGASPFYEGTSVLAGAQVLKRVGFFDSYYWGLNTLEIAKTIAYWGPGIAGLDWHYGMFEPDRDGFIHVLGSVAGGHAVLINSIKIVYKKTSFWNWKARTWADVDWDRSYFTIHNSWGKSWGQAGTCKITLREFDLVFQNNGEMCFPKRNAGLKVID